MKQIINHMDGKVIIIYAVVLLILIAILLIIKSRRCSYRGCVYHSKGFCTCTEVKKAGDYNTCKHFIDGYY